MHPGTSSRPTRRPPAASHPRPSRAATEMRRPLGCRLGGIAGCIEALLAAAMRGDADGAQRVLPGDLLQPYRQSTVLPAPLLLACYSCYYNIYEGLIYKNGVCHRCVTAQPPPPPQTTN